MRHVPIADGVCQVPNEFLIDVGHITVSVFGGDRRTVNTVQIEVVKSGYADGEPPEPPIPGNYHVQSPNISLLRTDAGTFQYFDGEWRSVEADMSGVDEAIGQVTGVLTEHVNNLDEHVSIEDREKWNAGGTPDVLQPDITVPPQFQWFIHPAGNIRGFKPSQNVSIQVNVPAGNVYAKKDFIYTVEPYEEGFVYPLSDYLIDFFVRGMNPGETFIFKVWLKKGDIVISEAIQQYTADSVGRDRISIISSDNPIQHPVPMDLGDKLTLHLEVATNSAQPKVIYIESVVTGGFFSGMTQNPNTISSENVTHYRDNDTFTTVGYELRNLQKQIDVLQAALKK